MTGGDDKEARRTPYGMYGRQPPHVMSGIAQETLLIVSSVGIIVGSVGVATAAGLGPIAMTFVIPTAAVAASGLAYANL